MTWTKLRSLPDGRRRKTSDDMSLARRATTPTITPRMKGMAVPGEILVGLGLYALLNSLIAMLHVVL